jgi:hypothetical protein
MRALFSFVVLPILCNSFGELLLKHRLNELELGHVPAYLDGLKKVLLLFFDGPLASYLAYTLSVMLGILFDPIVMFSVGTIFFGTVLWLIAMSKFELSYIYPFLSLNYVIILIGSQLVLGESVSLLRYGSVLLIVIGLVIISRSPYFEK